MLSPRNEKIQMMGVSFLLFQPISTSGNVQAKVMQMRSRHLPGSAARYVLRGRRLRPLSAVLSPILAESSTELQMKNEKDGHHRGVILYRNMKKS